MGTDVTVSAPGAARRVGPDAVRRVTLPAVWVASACFAFLFTRVVLSAGILGADAHAYWLTGRHAHLYGPAPRHLDAFLYSPAFATLVWPLTHLAWPLFLGLWVIAEATTFAWLLASLGWRWSVPLFVACTPELLLGNIYAFLALAAVVGIRHPSAWTFPLLTKLTPALGFVWFAVRMEWRSLGKAAVAAAAVVTGSVLLTPVAWAEWVRFLLYSDSEPRGVLYLRVAAAVLLTAFGARSNRTWLLAPAMLLACPVLGGFFPFTLLAAVPRLLTAMTDRDDDAALAR